MINKENKLNTKVIRKLSNYIGEYKKDTFLTWILVFVESICEVLVAFFTGRIVNLFNNIKTETLNLNLVYINCAIVAFLAIIAASTGILAGFYCASASVGFAKNLRKSMYDKIQEYSFANIDKFSAASIITRTTTDVTNVQFAFQSIIRAVIRAPFMMTFSLIMCFITAPKFAWIFLVIIPVILVFLLMILFKAHPIFIKIFNTYDRLNEDVQEDVRGIRVVKAFDMADYQTNRFKETSTDIYKNFVKAERILAFNSPIMNLSIYTAIIIIAVVGSKTILTSLGTKMAVGDLTTLVMYVMMIFNALMMISMVYTMMIISKNSSERIVEILDEKSDILNITNPVTIVKDGTIDFNNVSFEYHKGKEVLSNINLHLKSGETLGIIGSTGSSKTTLISLIARLYDVSKGEVLVGGVNVKNYDLKILRDEVSVVLQKNLLFTGTIKSNLLWGKIDATNNDLISACDVAQASDFINSFPEKFDTKISEGGTNVSGGQKQRLCIARALLKKSKILILDDSTSACDTHTDFLIRQGLKKFHPDMTKIIISQRVLSIKDCDKIIVMDKGKIVATGNNNQLLSSCNIYKELYDSQLKSGGDFDEAN